MSKPPSILSNLEALDVIADLGAATGRKGDRRQGNVTPLQQPSPATGGADAVYALLVELKRDIDALKHEQHAQQVPQAEAQLYGMLAELKRDIDSLRHEQVTHHLPPGEASLRGVLSELKRDIAALRHEQSEQHLPPGEAQLYGTLAELKRDIAALRHEQSEQHLPPGEAQLYGTLAELKRDIANLRHEQAQQAVPSGERQLYAMLADIKREIHDLQHAAHEPHEAMRPAVLRQSHYDAPQGVRLAGTGWSLREVAAFLPLLVVAAVAAYTFMRPGIRPVAPTPVATAPVAAPMPRGAASGASAAALLDVLSAPAVSPRGVSAQGVDPAQALARAGALMAEGGSARDSEEAGFWLRRYLGAAHGGDRKLLRALTQLGSLYAEPSPTRGPDYVSARLLWEVAGALGDPVGMCFLGRLHENGLGVPVDRNLAAQWLERANAAGGCNAR